MRVLSYDLRVLPRYADNLTALHLGTMRCDTEMMSIRIRLEITYKVYTQIFAAYLADEVDLLRRGKL
jgi:hypothetical protein